MPGPYLIGVDGGTQSSKVVVYDAEGAVVAEGRQALRPMSRPRHGVATHPDDDLWTSIAAASRRALEAFPGDPGEIVGLGLCTIRCCKAFLRADGSLVEPVISWMDDRAYRAYVPDDPAVAYATTSSGYLTHRLTGERRDTAANNILLQWPIDTDTWQWSDDQVLYEALGVERTMLFELQMPGAVAGHVTPEAAVATGIPAGLPVVATANDKAVEALGAGSLGEATALISLGTYIAAMVHGTENHPAPTHFWTNFGCIPHRYLYESHGVRRGMWTLTWFLDLLGEEVAERAAVARAVARAVRRARGRGRSRGQRRADDRARLARADRQAVPQGRDARLRRPPHAWPRLPVDPRGDRADHEAQRRRDVRRARHLAATRSSSRAAARRARSSCASSRTSSASPRRAVWAPAVRASAPRSAPPSPPASIRTSRPPSAAWRRRERRSLPSRPTTEVYRRMNETVYQTIRGRTDPILERAYPIFH